MARTEALTWEEYSARDEDNVPVFKWTQIRTLPILGEQPLPVKLRPDCRGCGVKLKPNISVVYEKSPEGRVGSFPTHRVFDGTYGVLSGYFHSGECAQRFAVAAAKAGYRYKGL